LIATTSTASSEKPSAPKPPVRKSPGAAAREAAAAAAQHAGAGGVGAASATPRPVRGDVQADTFQDQIRAPAPRGLPGEGRVRGEAAAGAAPRALQSDGGRDAARSAEERRRLEAVFAALPEDKEAPLQRPARAPFAFEDARDAAVLSERAYDRVLLDLVVESEAAAGARGENASAADESGGGAPAAPRQLTSENLREWALFALNPDSSALSDEELQAFEDAFVTFRARQGLAPPVKRLVPRGWVSGFAATNWLRETAEELALVREAAHENRRLRVLEEAQRLAAEAEAKRAAETRVSSSSDELRFVDAGDGPVDSLGI